MMSWIEAFVLAWISMAIWEAIFSDD